MDGSKLLFPNHSALLNLHLLVAHMEYKHHTSSVTNEQWLDFTSSDYLAFIFGPMLIIKSPQTPAQASRVESVIPLPKVESPAPTTMPTQEECNISPHLSLRVEIAPPSILRFFCPNCSPPSTC